MRYLNFIFYNLKNPEGSKAHLNVVSELINCEKFYIDRQQNTRRLGRYDNNEIELIYYNDESRYILVCTSEEKVGTDFLKNLLAKQPYDIEIDHEQFSIIASAKVDDSTAFFINASEKIDTSEEKIMIVTDRGNTEVDIIFDDLEPSVVEKKLDVKLY